MSRRNSSRKSSLDKKLKSEDLSKKGRARSRGNSNVSAIDKEAKAKGKKVVPLPMKMILSKKSPTLLNDKVDPVIYEGGDSELICVASGNTILVYSLLTGLLVNVMRSKGADAGGKASKGKKDVHKANIIMLSKGDQSGSTLFSLCS